MSTPKTEDRICWRTIKKDAPLVLMDYQKRIYNPRHYIEKNYNKTISIKSLEMVSCYSYRNLQRIFFSLFKETIGAYQTRLKVENGYKKIVYSNAKISDIALEIGFSDVQSFSKTFKKHFNCSPSQARNQKELLLNDTEVQNSIISITAPEILYIPKKTVYYLSCKTSYINPEIEQLWKTILKNDFSEVSTQFYGLIADDVVITEKSKCTYDACLETNSILTNLPSKSIFGGNYAKFIHQGSYQDLENTYQQIFGSWILESKQECSHTPVIEQYLKNESNCTHENEYLTALFIPLL
ncbi:AraC family transcriptional regulator [Flavobacterium succinicans]|nr:GyrI-like domain-containing protein [Flavobacterium succinicans]